MKCSPYWAGWSKMTSIVDYRAGNLTSVRLAFEALGEQAVVTSDPAVVASSVRVVFPGVGAAASAMENLAALGLADVVREAAASKPFLGICLGMQILFERSEEDGGVETLGIIPGIVRRFPDAPGFKIPQMGWNDVRTVDPSAPENGEFYYFVHSYCADVCPYTFGITGYAGVEFTSIVRKGRLLATQFHPEKSGKAGLALIKRWLES